MTTLIAPPEVLDAAPARALPAGTRLEEYDVEGVIAVSSHALVYACYDRVLKLHVALKEYLPDAIAMRGDELRVMLRERGHARCFERGRQAFVNEARLLAHCQHPSLPPVMRVLHHHGTVCSVMRSCSGPSLSAHRAARAGPPEAAVLRAWLDGLLGALADLHALGGVHGAVAPDKIVMLPDGTPVLMGSAAVRTALISGSTRGMMASLDPGFMPLEQREPSADRPLGPWTDLYALAATLHFFIGGQAPARLSDQADSAVEPLAALWQRLRGGQAVLPPQLQWMGALDTCLAERAEDRPQSVAQLRALLQAHDARLLGRGDPWTLACSAATAAGGEQSFPMVAMPPLQVDDLQQTLPFVAARAHQIAAAASAPALLASPPIGTTSRPRRWVAGAALMVMLTVSVAAAEWMRQRNGDAAVVATATGSAAPSAAVRPVASRPEPAGASLAGGSAARAEASPGAVAADTAVSASPIDAPASAAPVVRAPPSPRERCGSRSGYALYQCMQAQCARRSSAQHAQCVRLRQQQSLS